MRNGSEGAGMEVFGVTGHRRAPTAPTGRRAWEKHMAALGCPLSCGRQGFCLHVRDEETGSEAAAVYPGSPS